MCIYIYMHTHMYVLVYFRMHMPCTTTQSSAPPWLLCEDNLNELAACS